MAVLSEVPVQSVNYMAFPLALKRGNALPVDATEIWTSKTDAENYATSNPTAYIGQVITVVTTSIDPDTSATIYEVTMYQIVDADGTLRECGSGANAIFEDARFVAIKNAIETLQGDEDTAGSLKELQAMMTVTCTENTEEGIKHWKFYQNYTVSEDPDNPGEYIKTPIQIADVKIDADVFISEGSVVDVIDNVVESPTYDFTSDTATYTSIDEVLAAHSTITPSEGDTLAAIISGVTKYYKYTLTAGVASWEALSAYIDTEGDVPPSGVGKGTYMKLKLSSGDNLYIATEKLAKGLIKKITISGNDFAPDSNGVVNIESISTDWLSQGENLLILNCGDSTI